MYRLRIFNKIEVGRLDSTLSLFVINFVQHTYFINFQADWSEFDSVDRTKVQSKFLGQAGWMVFLKKKKKKKKHSPNFRQKIHIT